MESCSNIGWKDVYNIGHEKVDSEHKKLFELANNVANCINDKNEIMKSVKELVKYTKFHFANEEQYMKSINFTYLEDHKKLHKDIVNNLNVILENVNKMDFNEISEVLSSFIKNNIISHILTVDKRVHHFRRDKEELRKIFQWKDIYKINNEQIDKEHKKLFDIALKTLEYKEGTNIKEHIRNVLIELYDYMKIHFANEENHMRELQYEAIDEHIKIHETIIIQLNEFIKKLPTLSIEKFERLLIEYMDVWLINHIIVEDQKIICKENSISYNSNKK